MKSPLKPSPATEPLQQATPQALGFESTTGYPVGPESSHVSGFPAVQRYAAAGDDDVMQLKSHFTAQEKDADVETPIKSLSDGAKPFFEEAGLAEAYYFHGSGPVVPETYDDGFERARSATAVIERASYGKNGDRNNTVIGPYGHFGNMERSILGRANYGNIFDGGHLIERSMMEGADADVHGNLAPQEGKQFNQDLMRGWEHIPEEYQRYMDFTYSMQLFYTELSYNRTGQELVDAGVVPLGLLTALDTIGRGDAFRAHVFQFDRWIPYKWAGEIDAGAGKTFPQKSFPKGAHYQRLQATRADARQRVLGPDPLAPLMFAPPPLLRTVSGEVSGAIDGLAMAAGGASFFVGGGQTISSEMFTGVPHPMAEQAAGLRGGVVPAALPAFAGALDLLDDTFSLKRLRDGLSMVQTKKASGVGNLVDTTVDQAAKKIPEYRVIRQHVSAMEGAAFVRGLKQAVEADFTYVLTKAAFQTLATRYFLSDGSGFAAAVVYDPKCILGDPPVVATSASSAAVDVDDDVVDASSGLALGGAGLSSAFLPTSGPMMLGPDVDPDDDVVDASSGLAFGVAGLSSAFSATAAPMMVATPSPPPVVGTAMDVASPLGFGSGSTGMFPPPPLVSSYSGAWPPMPAPVPMVPGSFGTVAAWTPPGIVSAFPPVVSGFPSAFGAGNTGMAMDTNSGATDTTSAETDMG
jgi:hypothetical protein